jgi:predicted transcriptional regulator
MKKNRYQQFNARALRRPTARRAYEEGDAATLVGAAVKHFLIAREFGEEYTREEIEEKIARGLSQLDRGEGLDGDEVFEKLRVRGEELRRQRR